MPKIYCDICGAEFRKERTFSEHLKRSKCTNVSSLLSVLVKNGAIEVNNPDFEAKSPEISVNIETVKQEYQEDDQHFNFESPDHTFIEESFSDSESSVSETGFQEVTLTSDGEIPLFEFDNSESESDGVDWDYLESHGQLDTVENQWQVEECVEEAKENWDNNSPAFTKKSAEVNKLLKRKERLSGQSSTDLNENENEIEAEECQEEEKENSDKNSPSFTKNSAEVSKLRQRKERLSGQSSIDLNENEICHRKKRQRSVKRKKRGSSKTLVIISESSSSSSDDEKNYPSKRTRSATCSKEKVRPIVKPVFHIESDSNSECDLNNGNTSPKESPNHQPSTSNTISLQLNDAIEKEMPNEFSCGICKMCFSESSALETHIYTHNGIVGQQSLPEFICGICSKVFNCEDKLGSHMMQHMNNSLRETAKISGCKKDDTSRNETTKMTDPEYICGKCQQSFTSTNSLHTHLMTHLNIITSLTKSPESVKQSTPGSNKMVKDSTFGLIRKLLNSHKSESTGSQDPTQTQATSDHIEKSPDGTKKLSKLMNYRFQQ